MRGKEEGLRKLRCGWRGSREVGAEGVKVGGEDLEGKWWRDRKCRGKGGTETREEGVEKIRGE